MSKGFTLIELLAVIVILAIIALIATPIVLSIIDDSKESSMLRSAEMYLNGVENAVMRENMNSGGNFRPSECSITNGNMICGSTNVEVEVDGEVPSTGSIIFENGKITSVTLNYASGTIVKDASGNLVYEGSESLKTIDDVCTHVSGTAKTAGAKYSCEVKEGTSYNFYVLTTPAEGVETINLIMDQNINSDGTPAGMTGIMKSGENVYNLVAWMSKDNYGTLYPYDEDICWDESGCSLNDKGPVTAMNFLYNATKDWTNIDPVNYTYNDKTTQGTTNANTSYTSFVSSNGIATITPLTGDGVTIGSEATPLRARMPIYASDASITEVASKTDANAYLYDNLDPDGMNAPYGYWTLSSDADYSYLAWTVRYRGNVDTNSFDDDCDIGVRPVITLKL